MITPKELETQLKEILIKAGITNLPADLEERAETLVSNGVESIEDLKDFSKPDVLEYIGVKPLQVTKVLKVFRTIGKEEEKEIETADITIPKRPTDLSAFAAIEVTGNLEIKLDVVNSYIEIAMLRNLGIEKVIQKLNLLLTEKMKDYGTSATPKIIAAYKTLMKFNKTDPAVLALMDSDYFLINSRADTINTIVSKMFPAIIDFINDALLLRQEYSDLNTLLFRNLAKVKSVGNEINEQSVVIAVEELATTINRDLNSMHPTVAKQTVTLYQEVFELVNDKDIQSFLGATDSRTMFQQLGIKYSPKDVASFQQFPELIYGILSILENDEILKSDKGIYIYLQKIWQDSKIIQWAKLGDVIIETPATTTANVIAVAEGVLATNDDGYSKL